MRNPLVSFTSLKAQFRTILLPLGLLCVILLYNMPLLTMRGLAVGGDGVTLFYPAEYLLARSLRAGTLPFWCPELQSGFPLLADGQPGALYPPNILMFGLLPTPVAHNWVIFLHSLLGFLLTFYWARTLGLGTTAAGWSGFLFTMTTPLIGNNVPLLEALSWTPALFLFTEQLTQNTQTHSSHKISPLALVVALQWLAGFPQIAFYSFVATFIYLVLRSLSENLSGQDRLRLLLTWGISFLLGLAMSAPQLLPTYELSQYSIRAGGIQGSMAGEKSLFPVALVTYLLPSWRPFFSGTGLGFSGYIGLLPLLLAVLSLISGIHVRRTLPIVGMCTITLLLALGRFSLLFFIFRHLPGFSSFRVPSRFLLLTQLGLAVLAGYGWELLSRYPRPPAIAQWIKRGLVFLFLLLLLNTALAHPLLRALQAPIMHILEIAAKHVAADPYHVQPWSYYEVKITSLYRYLLEATSWQQPFTLLALVIVGTASLCWERTPSWTHNRRWTQWVWGALIITDVWASARWVHQILPIPLVTHSPLSAQIIQEDAPTIPYRVFWVVDPDAVTFNQENLELLPANYHALFNFSSTGIYSPLGFYTYYRLLKDLSTVNLAFGLRPVTAEAIQAHRYLLNLLNVRYVLSRAPLRNFTLLAHAGNVYVYRNEEMLPRAFIVDAVDTAASADEAIDWVRSNTDQTRTRAILQTSFPPTLTPGAALTATASIESYSATRVRIHTSAIGDVLVVLTDAFYPGWSAYLDGVPTPIYRADGVFRAVSVPSGDHLLTFRYRPLMFQKGVLVAVVSATATIALHLWPNRGSQEKRKQALEEQP